MKLPQFTKMIGSAATAVMLLATMSSGKAVAASNSMIAQHDIETPYGTVLELNVADLLRSKGEAVVKPFENLVAKLSRPDKTNCDVESEVRLVSVCRSLEGRTVDDFQTAQILEAVRSLYGIRKAICETGLSDKQIPYPCNNILPIPTSEMSHKRLARSELELVRTGNIPACLRKLQAQHYLWTSYSNNRQDANDMIHLLRSDVEMQSIVMTYRDFEDSVSGFREAFDKMHAETTAWYDEAGLKAQELFEKQNDTFVRFEQGFGNISTEVLQDLDRVHSMIEIGYGAINQLSSFAASEVSQRVKDSSMIREGIANIKNAIAELYAGAASEVVVATKSQTNAIETAFELLAEKTFALQASFRGLETLPDLNQLSNQLNDIHNRNLGQLQNQFALSIEIFDTQLAIKNSSLEALESVRQTFAGIESVHGSLSTLANLIELFHQYERIFITIWLYIALSFVLVPLEAIILPRKLVFNIKIVFLAFQAGIFILEHLDFTSKIAAAQESIKTAFAILPALHPIIWIIIVLISIGIALTWDYYINLRRKTVENLDIEQAVLKEFKRTRQQLRMCDRQRQRFESISRNSRYGSTPPGL